MVATLHFIYLLTLEAASNLLVEPLKLITRIGKLELEQEETPRLDLLYL